MEKWKFLTLPGLELRPPWSSSQSLYRLRYPGSHSELIWTKITFVLYLVIQMAHIKVYWNPLTGLGGETSRRTDMNFPLYICFVHFKQRGRIYKLVLARRKVTVALLVWACLCQNRSSDTRMQTIETGAASHQLWNEYLSSRVYSSDEMFLFTSHCLWYRDRRWYAFHWLFWQLWNVLNGASWRFSFAGWL
jgi:hypothetical protein